MQQEQSTSNGTKASEDKEKKDSKQSRRHKSLPGLPSASSASDMNDATYTAKVDRTPVDWSQLKNYEVFSRSPDGSFPMIKVSCSKAVLVTTREVFQVGSGRVHKISLSNH